jgi:hypothetical protein
MPIPLRVRIAARPKQLSVEALQARIADLSRERQDLRSFDAGEADLERNRLEIVETQWDLSRALVRRYLPAA